MQSRIAGHKARACIGRWFVTLRNLAALVLGAIMLASASSSMARTPAAPTFRLIPPLLVDDECFVVSEHHIQTRSGPLTYESVVGRIPIRTEHSGQVRGRIFFVAYIVKAKGAPRPITFAWNGGPLVASAIVHMEGLGPRRRTPNGMVDNPDTLLTQSDLVFMDAMETGFSRPASPEFAPEFMNLVGDVNATAEFIRAYRARFRAEDQPLFIAGESYGDFRAAALADQLTAAHQKVAGTILISGDIPNIPQPPEFYDAMHVPARTATAFYYKRLPPDLMKDPDATIRAAANWARTVYMAALERKASLTVEQRDGIANDLARYIGMSPSEVNHDTLVVPAEQYLDTFLSPDQSKKLTEEDTRLKVGDPGDDLGDPKLVDHYIRDELGYATDLTYDGLEKGYAPFPGNKEMTVHEMWVYNQPGVTPEVRAELQSSGEVSPLARVNPPWIVNALKQDKDMRVFVATGRFDPLNMCEGDAIAAAQLPPDLSSRIQTHCYESGHIIYRDDKARPQFLNDLGNFIRDTMAVHNKRG